MTRHAKPADLGPLFNWNGPQSGTSGTSGSREIITETVESEGHGPGSPDRSGLNVPYHFGRFSGNPNNSPRSGVFGPPDRASEKPNDSGQDPRSGIYPLRGRESPDCAVVPPVSSAALSLRSQRTDTVDPAPAPDRSEAPEIGSAPELRPYQVEAIAAVERELAGHRSTLLVLPTGCGKTVVFAELTRRYVARDERVLVLAHRGELLEQAQAKLHAAGVTLAAIEQADRRATREHAVVIGSVQTLSGRRMRKFPPDHFALIIVDESHHAAARSYRSILEYFAPAKVLGVTATPDRGDGKALGKIFETVAFTYEMRRAIAEGYLSPLRAKRILVEDLDLSEVRTHHGDLDQGQLSELLNDERNLLGVVRPLLEQAGDRKTLVFGVDVAHARALAEVINAHKPGKAIALDGSAKPEERKAVLSLFRQGVFQYMCNCALFTEGFDEPDVACVALARPTQSRALYTQMLGRGTRLAPGKTDCLVLDFVGNSGRHRLIGPADALAGRELTDDERKIAAKKLADGQLELEELLAASEREAAEQKAARRRELNSAALVLYREREVDVFLGDLMPAFDRDSAAARRPATPQQLAEIERCKLGKPPIGVSEAEAAAMLQAVKARREAGLCTIPQARLLERMGCDSKGVTFTRAGQLISMLAAANWKPFVLAGQPEYKPNRRRA